MNERKITYTPKATPYLFRVPVTMDELKAKQDAVWERDKEVLCKNTGYKGRKKKGGKIDFNTARPAVEKAAGMNGIYNQDIASWVKGIIEEEYGKPVMMVNSVNIQYTDTDQAFVELDLYAYPEAELTSTAKEEIQLLKLKRKELPTEEEFLDERILSLQNTHVERTPADTITEESEVVFDLYTSIEGNRYENGIVRLLTTDVKDVTPYKLKEALVGHKVGDKFSVQFINELEDEFRGKLVEAEVTIQASYTKSVPDSSDVYKFVPGCETTEDFVKSVSTEYSEYAKNSERDYVFSEIINYILQNSDMDPIPEQFIDHNIRRITGNDKSTDNQMAAYIYQQIMVQVTDKMCSFCYIDLFGLDRSISHEELVDFMMDHITYE